MVGAEIPGSCSNWFPGRSRVAGCRRGGVGLTATFWGFTLLRWKKKMRA